MRGSVSREDALRLLAKRRGNLGDAARRAKKVAENQLAVIEQNRLDASGAHHSIRTNDPRFGAHSDLYSGDV